MKNRNLVMLSLLVALGCAREYIGEDPPTDRLHFPIGIGLHPSGEAALVVSSNFDLGFNRGVVHAIDLAQVDARLADAQGKIEEPIEDVLGDAAFVPSFGGQVRFDPSGDHAFLANRQDGTLVELELSGEPAALRIGCGDREGDPPDCTDGDHVVQLDGSDSYSVLVRSTGDAGARVFAGSLNGGKVSVVDARYDVDGAGRLTLPSVIESQLARASGMTTLPASATNPEYLLVVGELDPEGEITGSPGAHLKVFGTSETGYAPFGSWELVGANQAMDARDIVVSTELGRAFVAQRYPDSIAALDLNPGQTGSPLFRNIAVRSVGRRPTALAIDAAAPGGPQVLVTCYGDDSLYALDATTLTVVDVLREIGRGPTDLVLDEARGRAYVTLFSEDTVAVVALDRPDHIGLEVVARLGRQRPEAVESFSLDPFQWF